MIDLIENTHSLEHKGLSLPARMRRLMAQLNLMLMRHRQRRLLTSLEDWQLDDIGLEREQVRAEARKPFWR